MGEHREKGYFTEVGSSDLMEFLSLGQNLKVPSDSSQDHLSSILIHIPGISHCFSTTWPLLGVMGISRRWTKNTWRCKVEKWVSLLGGIPYEEPLHRFALVPGAWTGLQEGVCASPARGLLAHPRCLVRVRPLRLWKGCSGAVLVRQALQKRISFSRELFIVKSEGKSRSSSSLGERSAFTSWLQWGRAQKRTCLQLECGF